MGEPHAGRTKLVAALLAGGAGAAAWSLIEAQWPVLRHAHVTGVLHHTQAPLRVLHVSDLHLSVPQSRITAFVAGLGELDHDVAVVTGDLLGGQGMEESAVHALEPLITSGAPGLVVFGSNDFTGPVRRNPLLYLRSDSADGKHGDNGPPLDTALLRTKLQGRGWHVLEDDTVAVTTRRGTVTVTGLRDPHTSAPLVSRTDLPAPTAAITHLGMVHSPYLAALDRLVEHGADMLLAGHTHGGQVRVPGLGALVTNCDLPRDKARGVSHHGDVPLHVSAGLGTSPHTPIRFACRPEATLLTLLP